MTPPEEEPVAGIEAAPASVPKEERLASVPNTPQEKKAMLSTAFVDLVRDEYVPDYDTRKRRSNVRRDEPFGLC